MTWGATETSRGSQATWPSADHLVYGWITQGAELPLAIRAAEGVHLIGEDGRRYADFASGQINVNVGYSHPRVLAAMEDQLRRVAYVAPGLATEPRTRLAAMVAERAPPGLDHVFFTNTGAEGVETAVKIARAVTGRLKIYSAWRSYHGATALAGAASGDPRRLHGEPGPGSMAKFHFPSCYRCAFGQENPASCAASCLRSLEQQILLDCPETIAAVLMEPIVGTSGVYIPPAWFMRQLRELCTRHGILLVLDETMTGWGRTGRWFACEHFDVIPDILITAKGLTSGYVPLGAVVMSEAVFAHFRRAPFVAGSTTEGHALACAAGIANLQIYEDEGLIDRSATLGALMLQRLEEIKTRHPCVGDVRGIGLFACVELTSDRSRRAPLAGYRNSETEVATRVTRALRAAGVVVLAKWDFIFLAPPLTIERGELEDGLSRLDEVLSTIDKMIDRPGFQTAPRHLDLTVAGRGAPLAPLPR